MNYEKSGHMQNLMKNVCTIQVYGSPALQFKV